MPRSPWRDCWPSGVISPLLSSDSNSAVAAAFAAASTVGILYDQRDWLPGVYLVVELLDLGGLRVVDHLRHPPPAPAAAAAGAERQRERGEDEVRDVIAELVAASARRSIASPWSEFAVSARKNACLAATAAAPLAVRARAGRPAARAGAARVRGRARLSSSASSASASPPPPPRPRCGGDGDGDGDGDDEYEYEYSMRTSTRSRTTRTARRSRTSPRPPAPARPRRGSDDAAAGASGGGDGDGDGDGDGLGGPTLPSTLGDPFVYFEDPEYERFVNMMMMKGKKQTSRTILWKAFAQLREGGHDPMPTFRAALANARPMVEVRTRRNNQVPFPLTPRRAEGLAMKWLVWSARKRNTRGMAPALAAELLAASQMKGGAVGRRDEMHKSALANQAAAHFRWRGGDGGAAGAIDMETSRARRKMQVPLADALERRINSAVFLCLEERFGRKFHRILRVEPLLLEILLLELGPMLCLALRPLLRLRLLLREHELRGVAECGADAGSARYHGRGGRRPRRCPPLGRVISPAASRGRRGHWRSGPDFFPPLRTGAGLRVTGCRDVQVVAAVGAGVHLAGRRPPAR